jgi:hypothetical protein
MGTESHQTIYDHGRRKRVGGRDSRRIRPWERVSGVTE